MRVPAFITTPTPRALLLLMAGFSAAMLSAALVAQYGFGLHPCKLCLYQRYPYAAIAALALPVAFFVKSSRLLVCAAWFCLLLLLADAGIAGYHAGVEWGVIPGPSSCSNPGGGGQTIEEMRAEIMNAPLVPCDQAMAHVLGLSLAAWNALAALAMAALSFVALRKIRGRA